MKQDEFKKLLDKALKPIKKTLTSQSDDLAILRSSVVSIEETNKVYGDMYKINDDNVRKLEKRIEPLEEDAGIEIPPELTLLKVH